MNNEGMQNFDANGGENFDISGGPNEMAYPPQESGQNQTMLSPELPQADFGSQNLRSGTATDVQAEQTQQPQSSEQMISVQAPISSAENSVTTTSVVPTTIPESSLTESLPSIPTLEETSNKNEKKTAEQYVDAIIKKGKGNPANAYEEWLESSKRYRAKVGISTGGEQR